MLVDGGCLNLLMGPGACLRVGEGPCLAENATGPMAKLPHDGSVTADRDAVCFVASNFRVQPDQHRDEILLSVAHWWRLSWWTGLPE